MLNELLKTRVDTSIFTTSAGTAVGPVNLNGSPGDLWQFTPVAPVKLLKWGFMNDAGGTSYTTAATFQLTLAFQPVAGSATGRVNIDTLTVASGTAIPAGTGYGRNPYQASTTSTSIPSEVGTAGPLGSTPGQTNLGQTQYILSLGQAWVFALTTALGATATGHLWIEYELLPISKPSGYGTTSAGTVSLTDNLTLVAS
jgi:hypothetical protein